jgi:hypothetical protein
MLKHIVMWKLKENADGKSKDEIAKTIIERIGRFKGMPGMGALEVGIDINRSASAFDLALYSEFESVEALDSYQNNPDHIVVRDYIQKVTENRIVVDYEI